METTRTFALRHYDLAATLASGQAFRWESREQRWVGVIGTRWVRLHPGPSSLTAETATPVPDWHWLTHYLQLDMDLAEVLRTFPDDEPMRAAVAACRGLRLLRQDPWECLASFILSSTKQIVQIRQIVALLCERYGDPVPVASACPPAFAFPRPARLARATEAELRACKMGFRAPYLLATARLIASGQFDLTRLHALPIETARTELVQLPGVGQKIADCVLLFAYGFESAFPVDVWVMKALRQLYFPSQRVRRQRLHHFAATHFGPRAGYAQQYLFHYMRTKANQPAKPAGV
ncbi:MAG: DNA-3-methyladenine glycosylase family protein [Limisphaerales bacterium]